MTTRKLLLLVFLLVLAALALPLASQTVAQAPGFAVGQASRLPASVAQASGFALGQASRLPGAAGQAPSQPAGQPNPSTGTSATTVLAPGLNPVPDYRQLTLSPPAPQVPEGFTSLFNGVDLTGWHISSEARHGTTPDFHVAHGMIIGTQRPLGRGGLLITDKKFKDFELFLEARPDFGNDSGIFFRTSELGAAYQITMDYLPGGSMGRFIQEGGLTTKIAQVTPVAASEPRPPDPGMSLWKHEEWNTVRVRVEGEAPHVTVWINGQQVSDARDAQNSVPGGMVAGPIALQIHGGPSRWQPGGFWRWRNIAIRELK